MPRLLGKPIKIRGKSSEHKERGMSGSKRKMPVFGHEVDVTDVSIKRASEHFNEYELDDGTVLSVKSVATSMMRVEGQFTPDGRPIYIVLTSPAVRVVSSPLTPGDTTKDVKKVQ
jgi:hypothetical protein